MLLTHTGAAWQSRIRGAGVETWSQVRRRLNCISKLRFIRQPSMDFGYRIKGGLDLLEKHQQQIQLSQPSTSAPQSHSSTMKFNSLLAVIAAACSTQLVHAIDWGTICSEPNFGGDCTTYQSDTLNKCGRSTSFSQFPFPPSSLMQSH